MMAMPGVLTIKTSHQSNHVDPPVVRRASKKAADMASKCGNLRWHDSAIKIAMAEAAGHKPNADASASANSRPGQRAALGNGIGKELCSVLPPLQGGRGQEPRDQGTDI